MGFTLAEFIKRHAEGNLFPECSKTLAISSTTSYRYSCFECGTDTDSEDPTLLYCPSCWHALREPIRLDEEKEIISFGRKSIGRRGLASNLSLYD